MSLFLHLSSLSKAGLSTLQRGGGETDGFLPSHPFATIATVCRPTRETFFLSSHFFFIFKKHSAAELVHQAFTAQFSYIPRVGLTRCNAFPFGQLFKGEVLQKCGEQRRTSNSEKCHFDLNQKHKPHLSRSTISNDFSDGLSPVSPCMLSAANQENLLKMQNMVRTNPPE